MSFGVPDVPGSPAAPGGSDRWLIWPVDGVNILTGCITPAGARLVSADSAGSWFTFLSQWLSLCPQQAATWSGPGESASR